MYKLKNNKNFLITINLKNSQSMHIMPRDYFEVSEEDFKSPDLQSKIKAKYISIVSVPQIEPIVEVEIKSKK